MKTSKQPIRVARISEKNLKELLSLGYVIITSGWGIVKRNY
jgi:hypothetical protein